MDRKFINFHPKFRRPAERLNENLAVRYKAGTSQFRFELFEGFRLPERQTSLLAKKASKAGPWESAHQYGLAGDWVPFLNQAEAAALGVKPGWFWPKPTDECWKVLKQEAERCGLLVPITWDLNHVESPLFAKLLRVINNW